MDLGTKSTARRQEIRKNRPDAQPRDWQQLHKRGIPQSLAIVAAFFILATAIMLLRQNVVPFRVDQPVTHDIVSRVKFSYFDGTKLAVAQTEASSREPRVYKADEDVWQQLEKDLLSLPIRMSAASEPPADLAKVFDDAGSRTALRAYGAPDAAKAYDEAVKAFVLGLVEYRNKSASGQPLRIIPAEDHRQEKSVGQIRIGNELPILIAHVYSIDDRAQLGPILQSLAEKSFPLALQGRMVEYTLGQLKPTHRGDDQATAYRKNEAASAVPRTAGNRNVVPNEVLVSHRLKPFLDDKDVSLLRAENAAYLESLKGSTWKPYLGIIACTLIISLVMAAYVAAFQPRAVKNYARGGAIAGLMLAMLLLATLAGVGSGPLYLFGTAPTLLVAMILAIAYDRRFAMGISSLHGLLVTIALDQPAPFFLVLWIGVLVAGFMLDDVRTRSKLVEIGGIAAIAMMFATGAAGMLEMESGRFVLRNCLYTGAAGIAAGFIVLGILPFIEKMFRITTSMTLLELGDPSQPLFRRLQVEAPGTYNHSLQVANLAEAAAKAIGADSLLCRVAAYYHDVGKINKPDYFVENQSDGHNRHINLDPNLSLLIIVGHVKDGVELAREYNLPTSIVPFIQQHHGTTVVEYFYRRACTQQEQRDPTSQVSESHYRYPGPRPRTKETGIMMLADCAESATRALGDPTPAQIEGLVRDLTGRRLLDRQFDECELTMKELELIQRSLIKSLAGIYHGRIPYPSQQTQAPTETMQTTVGQVGQMRTGTS